jgi:site-specific recombinase XerD
MKQSLFICQLGEYFEVFLPDVRKASKNTIAAYADSFTIFFRFLQESKHPPHHLVTYKNFTPALFDEYLLWMRNERNYSDASICQRMTAIVAFLKYASRRDVHALNAYATVKSTELPSKPKTEFPYFTVKEMQILLRSPKPNEYLGSRDLVFLSFMYDTAARAQELCDVTIGDIRFGVPAKVTLRGKGNKAREIPISDETAKLLGYHLKGIDCKTRESKAIPLFKSQSGSKMTTACVRSIVAKYVAAAQNGYPDLFCEKAYSPHSFRHSKAVHMVEAGVPIIYIRNFLGHSSISSTEIYARVGQEAVTKALTERKIPRLSPNSDPTLNGIAQPLPNFIINAKKFM